MTLNPVTKNTGLRGPETTSTSMMHALEEEVQGLKNTLAHYQTLIKEALDKAGAPTHHPQEHGSLAPMPMTPQQRIAWLASRDKVTEITKELHEAEDRSEERTRELAEMQFLLTEQQSHGRTLQARLNGANAALTDARAEARKQATIAKHYYEQVLALEAKQRPDGAKMGVSSPIDEIPFRARWSDELDREAGAVDATPEPKRDSWAEQLAKIWDKITAEEDRDFDNWWELTGCRTEGWTKEAARPFWKRHVLGMDAFIKLAKAKAAYEKEQA